MTALQEMLDRVRDVDPLDDNEQQTWHEAARWQHFLPSAERPEPVRAVRWRHRRAPIVLAAALVATTGVAAAAQRILGERAPDSVARHIEELDAGMPPDLRYNADTANARSVATTTSAVLYLAETEDGGYCLEIASDGVQPRGAVCLTRASAERQPLQVTAPIPASSDAPLLVGGRANDGRITEIRVEYADGAVATVPFGTNRSWLLEIPDNERDSALSEGLRIVAIGAAGATIADAAVPALLDDDPTGDRYDTIAPLFVSTISDDSDFTKVLGVEGRLNAPGAERLEIVYPDGGAYEIPLNADRSYRYMLPQDRIDDLHDKPATIRALDANGDVVATAPVASVSYWRARNDGVSAPRYGRRPSQAISRAVSVAPAGAVTAGPNGRPGPRKLSSMSLQFSHATA